MEFEFITTQTKVESYLATVGIFEGLMREIRELSRKKPDATLNSGKVKIINRVLEELLLVLEAEPEAKFLGVVTDDELPQTSDAVLIMVQFETALEAFRWRYRDSEEFLSETGWVTEELVAEYEEGSSEEYDDD